MKPGSIILLLALCLGFGSVHAQPIQGIYIGAGAGLRMPTPTRNTPIASGFNGYFDLDQHLGYDTQISIGYALGNGWRFELEGNYGRSNISGVSSASFPAVTTGRIRDLGFMTNAIFDMDVGSPYVYPYLGLGVGYQSTRLDGVTVTRTDAPVSMSASGQAGGVAWQSIVGVSLPIPNMPGLSITIDYRFMDVLGGEKFNGSTSIGSPPVAVGSATKFHNQFTHNVLFGIRYAFNTPPPATVAPQAMAAPVDARTYQVHLGLDVTTLSDRALAIVREAVRESGAGRTARIEVSSAATSDQTRTERGARTVEAALVSEGVPRDAIAIRGRGMQAGAHDPRVEIVAE